MRLFGRKRLIRDDPYFGRLTFMSGDYWEGELLVAGAPEKVGLVLHAPASGPSEKHAAFCSALLDNLDSLFARCRPVFEDLFDEWTGRPFPFEWRDEFALVGLELPEDGDGSHPWNVCYFVDAANHYFTAFFENGRPSYATVDG